jgi:16S rRNA G966 N2-methylase RsmD
VLGFEAASRGAASVVLVERDRASFADALRDNASALLRLDWTRRSCGAMR